MWFALFSIIFYILSLLLIAPFLMNSSEGKLSQSKIPFFLTALAAIVLHAVSTFPLLEDLASGQSFLSMFLVSTMWFVLPIVYAFSIISLIFATFLSSHIIQMLNQNTLMLFHIGLSLFTYAVCFIATLYVIQLVWLDRNLKKRKIQFSPAIPPLMAVERHFFCLFAMGEVLLTLTLISGTYHVLQAVTPENLHKAIFSFLAWISFGIACFGHWRLGWRGKRMIIYAISGIILLTIGYFGSRLI